jgi:hypothetical protein
MLRVRSGRERPSIAQREGPLQGGQAYFALPMERRLCRAHRSLPRWPLEGRYPPILLKNSNFRIDHNSGDPWRPR